MSDQIFDCKQGVGTCVACGKNFECGAKKGPFDGDFTLEGWIHIPIKRGDDVSNQEVYHSSTLGPIPLSFTGRRLMQNLRDAFQEMLKVSCEAAKRGQVRPASDWEDVSKARGKLAQYMSQLEKRAPQSLQWQSPLDTRCKPAAMVLDYVDPKSTAELQRQIEVLRKGNDAFKETNQRLRESNSRYLCEVAALKKELEQARAARTPNVNALAVLGDTVSIVPSKSLREAMERAVEPKRRKPAAKKKRKG